MIAIGLTLYILGFIAVFAYPIVVGEKAAVHHVGDVFLVALFWPALLSVIAVVWPWTWGLHLIEKGCEKIALKYVDAVLAVARRKEQKAKLLAAPIEVQHTDIKIETKEPDYRHMNCTGCGKELTKDK